MVGIENGFQLVRSTGAAGAMRLAIAISLVTLAIGCREERIAQASREASQRQAQQNELVGRVVEEFLANHKEISKVQQRLQEAWTKLEHQWEVLDAERHQIAADRRTESLLLALSRGLGMVLLALAVWTLARSLILGVRTRTR